MLEPDGPDLSGVVDAAWELYRRASTAAPNVVVTPAMPVLFFGDLAAYRRSPRRIVTVALNPSNKEFPPPDPWVRFPVARDLSPERALDDAARDRYLAALSAYFTTRPYSAWFDASFERVLHGLDASYYPARASVALHTDIASPVATDPTWSRLGPTERAAARDEDARVWRMLVEALSPDLIVVSTGRDNVAAIGAAPLDEWGVLTTIEQSTPLVVRATSATFGGREVAVVFAPSAQVPFGRVSYEDRERIGRAIGGVLDGAPVGPAPTVPPRSGGTRPPSPVTSGDVHPSFAAFMRSVVLPLRAANPTWRRLDGASTGGNRTVAGQFRHAAQLWKVHADTHFAPLEIAWRAVQADATSDPFVVEHAQAGRCLALRDDLRRQYASPHKHLYIYEL
jgi:hypothetical protein